MVSPPNMLDIELSKISRQVGWLPREVSLPKSIEEVEQASDYQLIEWNRFIIFDENLDEDVRCKILSKVWDY